MAKCQGDARVAQLVEHMTENHGVGGSIPSPGTTGLIAIIRRKLEKPQKSADFIVGLTADVCLYTPVSG